MTLATDTPNRHARRAIGAAVRRGEPLPSPHAILYRVNEVPLIGGPHRTKLYELIKEGRILARKCGSRTLIDGDSLRAYLASLPVLPARKAA